ncbi:MAG: hypothetical protein JWP52_1620 [Rhizobacter sp.]|nr:hypothetical protein [Rhizobacter sp.]
MNKPAPRTPAAHKPATLVKRRGHRIGRVPKREADRTAELQHANAQTRFFALELDRSIEAERRRLAREVHDQFGQIATGMKMIVMRLAQDHPEFDRQTIGELTQLLDEAVATARHIAAELRPPLLDDLGFEAAVDHYTQKVARQSGLEFRLDVTDDALLSAGQANQLFRILQEALTNVLRHADASVVEVHGKVVDASYRLRVTDNGHGPKGERVASSGLLIMQERAAMAGGWLRFGPGHDGGTEVTACVSLKVEAAS